MGIRSIYSSPFKKPILKFASAALALAFAILGEDSENIIAPFFGCLAFALLWYSIEHLGKLQRFICSAGFFACLQLKTLFWMSDTQYQGLYFLVVYFALSMAIGLQFAVLSLFIADQKLNGLKVLQLSSLWFLMEISRLGWFCGFTWSYLGQFLANNLYTAQFASNVGIYGLSFICLLLNLLFYNALKKDFRSFVVFCSVLGSLIAFGMFRVAFYEKQIKESLAQKATLVQTAILPSEKTPLSQYRETFIPPLLQWASLVKLIEKESMHPKEWLVLPESCVSFCLDDALCTIDAALEMLRDCLIGDPERFMPPQLTPFIKVREGVVFVTNAFFAQFLANFYDCKLVAGFDLEEGKGSYFNAAFLFTKHANPLLLHCKQKLLPIAEYAPFEWCKKFAIRYGIYNFFSPKELEADKIKNLQMAANICLEDTFSSLVRKQRSLGANIVFNISNDGWYPSSNLSYKHFKIASLRSIENGIWMLRSANCGISAFTDPLGRAKLSFFTNFKRYNGKALAFKETFSQFDIKTFYSHWGNIPLLIFSFITLGLITPSLNKKPIFFKLFQNKKQSKQFN